MNLISSLLFKGASAYYTIVKNFLWKNHFSISHKINILEEEKFSFVHFGDITKILYKLEHLVPYNMGFEYSTLKIFKSLLKEGFTVLDIGANIGLFSLLASAKIGKNSKIYAFEPIPKTHEILERNLKINNIQNVVATQIALSNFVGQVSFDIPKEMKFEGEGDAFNSMNLNLNNENSQNMISCTTLDCFLKANKITKVDLIKIDVEGAEILCFQGATGLLGSANPPIIIMECAESLCSKFNYKVFDVLDYLQQFGYKFEQYEYNQWLALPKNHSTIFSKELLK